MLSPGHSSSGVARPPAPVRPMRGQRGPAGWTPTHVEVDNQRMVHVNAIAAAERERREIERRRGLSDAELQREDEEKRRAAEEAEAAKVEEAALAVASCTLRPFLTTTRAFAAASARASEIGAAAPTNAGVLCEAARAARRAAAF